MNLVLVDRKHELHRDAIRVIDSRKKDKKTHIYIYIVLFNYKTFGNDSDVNLWSQLDLCFQFLFQRQ